MLQLADSAFPSGGFVHSAGLESAWQQGFVTRRSLDLYCDGVLGQIASGGVPFVAAAWRKPGRFEALDALFDTMTLNHIANNASRLQGRALLSSAEKIFDIRALSQLDELTRHGGGLCHLAPVFGVVGRGVGLTLEQTCGLFVFCGLRGLISAAVRLGLVGPIEGQAIQHALSPTADALARSAAQVDPEDAAQTAPLVDLLQAGHGRLYSRLFQS